MSEDTELSPAEQAEACRFVLANWIAGWPDVRRWRFETHWVKEWQSVRVVCTRLTAKSQVWKSQDLIPWKMTREDYNDAHHYIEYRAETRYHELLSAVAAVQKETQCLT